MLQHLWIGPISNASVGMVQGGRFVEVRANEVLKGVGISGILGQLIHDKDMKDPIDYVLCVGHFFPKVNVVYFRHTEDDVEKTLHEIEETHLSYLFSVKKFEVEARSCFLYR